MRDYEYFKSLYPLEVKRLQVFAEAAVDEMDYEGSPIYDEYPERLLLDRLTRRAAENAGIDMDWQDKNLANEMFKAASTETEKKQPGNIEDGSSRIFWDTRNENSALPQSVEIEGNGYWMWEPMTPEAQAQKLQMQERQNGLRSGRRGGQNPPPWGPPPGGPQNPPPWGPPPGGPQSPPPWGPPPRKGLSQRDVLNVLLLHELQQRRNCQRGRCF